MKNGIIFLILFVFIAVSANSQNTKARGVNPVRSVFVSTFNFISFRNHFPNGSIGDTLEMNDTTKFKIFRHVVVGKKKKLKEEKGAIFIIRFKLAEMSVDENEKYSRRPIPMFIGLPGFRAKFWMNNSETGYNQGIYQWKTEQDAINYSNSFAVDFMSKRSVPGSISFEIIPNTNIYEYVSGLKKRSMTDLISDTLEHD